MKASCHRHHPLSTAELPRLDTGMTYYFDDQSTCWRPAGTGRSGGEEAADPGSGVN
jgi:hypothetical protein